MGKYKGQVNKHLLSAKDWVSRAEHSFEEKKDIRGELNLFLAQAEIAHAQKASRLRRMIQYPLFKQTAGLAVALLMVAAGLGASYLLNTSSPERTQQIMPASSRELPLNYPITRSNDFLLNKEQPNSSVFPAIVLPQQNLPENEQANDKQTLPPVLPAKAALNHAEKPADSTLASKPEQPNSPAPVSLSKEQIKTLIRSAGDSLRGKD